MSSFKNILKQWVIPPAFTEMIQKELPTINNGRYRDRIKHLVAKNEKYKLIHQGEKCYILATGPSVKEQDLKVLKDSTCISVGLFFLHKDIEIIRPKYHVVAPNHTPFRYESYQKIFKLLEKHESLGVELFFGYYDYEYSILDYLNKFNKNNSLNFLDHSDFFYLNEDNFLNNDLWDITKSVFIPRTVIYSAIILAKFMGFKEIYLVGCDHDYLNEMKRVENHHFYNENEGVSDIEHLSKFTSERWFREYYLRWRDYRLIQDYLNHYNAKIYNSTEGGLLDVFNRVKLSDTL